MARLENHRVEDRGYVTPCWIWQGATNEKGYGYVSHNGQWSRVHRVSYEERHGPTDSKLDHLCRERACMNPDHLETVTTAENNRRAVTTKLTKEQVSEIRSLYPGMTQQALADQFGVSRRHIRQILSGDRWNG